MRRGKNICNELKAVRRRIAEENGIPLQQPECKHTGDCLGTCPRCEAEMRYLEQALKGRLSMGKAATVAGLTLSLAACGGSADSSLTTGKPLELPDTAMTRADSMAYATVVDDEPPDLPDGTYPVVLGFIENEFDSSIAMSEAARRKASEAIVPKEEEDGEGELLGVIIEDYAEFPGGEDALYKFLDDNVRIPNEFCGTGTVVVRFVVEKDGSISKPQVIRHLSKECDDEALRVVGLMPKWKPGSQSGIPVRQEFTLPISFFIKG